MVVVVWGTRVRRKPLGHTLWSCPACGRLSPATVQLVETSAHIYFVPLGYSPAGHSATCHWCDSEMEIDIEDCPTIAEGWKPGDAPAELAAALGISVDPRDFQAPATGQQLLVLWDSLRRRRAAAWNERTMRPDLKAIAIACAISCAALMLFCLVMMATSDADQEGPPAAARPWILLGCIPVSLLFGVPSGLMIGAPIRALFAHPAYVHRKLREALGPEASAGQVQGMMHRLRTDYARLRPLTREHKLTVYDLLPGSSPPASPWPAQTPSAASAAGGWPAPVAPSAQNAQSEAQVDEPSSPPPTPSMPSMPSMPSTPSTPKTTAFRFNVQSVEPDADGRQFLRGRVKSGEVRLGDRLLLGPSRETQPAVVVGIDGPKGPLHEAGPGVPLRLTVLGIAPGEVNVGDSLVGAPRPQPDPAPAPPAPAAAPAPNPVPPSAAAQMALDCPHCGKGLRIKAALAGRTVRCPACQKPFRIGEP